MKISTVVKNSIGKYGMIQDQVLKPIVGKKVTVTIDVDGETELTETVKAEPVKAVN